VTGTTGVRPTGGRDKLGGMCRCLPLLCLLLAAPAGSAPSNASAQAKAATAYAEGKVAFEAQDWARALERFEYAYMIDPAPTLLYNMARAAEEAQQPALVVRYYGLYLARHPKAEDRDAVSARMQTAQQALDRAAAAPPPSAERGPMPYVWLGVGVASLAAGAWAYTQALDSADEIDGLFPAQIDRRDELEDRTRRYEIGAWGAFAVGAAGLGVGAWLLLDDRPPAVSLSPTPEGATVSWGGRF
jgi:hypothetical protein